MWNLPRPGIKLVFSALADRVLTTVSPRKSIRCFDIAKAKVLFLLGGYYICMLLSRFSCVWLCDPIDSSPSGSPVPGILQARTLEWVAISFSNVWKWKVKVKSLSRVRRPHELQPTRLPCPWDFPGKSIGVGCHCLLQLYMYTYSLSITCQALSVYIIMNKPPFINSET